MPGSCASTLQWTSKTQSTVTKLTKSTKDTKKRGAGAQKRPSFSLYAGRSALIRPVMAASERAKWYLICEAARGGCDERTHCCRAWRALPGEGCRPRGRLLYGPSWLQAGASAASGVRERLARGIHAAAQRARRIGISAHARRSVSGTRRME